MKFCLKVFMEQDDLILNIIKNIQSFTYPKQFQFPMLKLSIFPCYFCTFVQFIWQLQKDAQLNPFFLHEHL